MDRNGLRRYFRKRFDTFCWPMVVRFREKHHDDQFACINSADLERVCLAKLWQRYHMNYYCVNQKPAKLPVTQSAAKTWPAGAAKRGLAADWENYQTALRRYEEETERLKLVEAALRERCGELAFTVLEACTGGEYEGFEIDSGKIGDLPKGNLLSDKPEWM